MNYGNIKKYDIADGIGVRVSLFVSGCRHHCKGCFQPETWNFAYGSLFTGETEEEILEALSPSYIEGLTLLGGEPMEPENLEVLLPFLRRVKEKFPDKTIWCYSGYTLEQLQGRADEGTDGMLSLIDVLVDGEFVEEKKNLRLKFRGSENQRLIDLPETLKTGSVVLWDA